MLRKLFFLFPFLAFPFALFSQDLVKLPELQKLIQQPGPVKVINFWATWCAPCVKEMPLFEKLNQEDKNSKVILVSMDYDLDPDPAKVKKFIERKKILSQVVILAEENPNDWIEKIDKSWSGALPSTLVVNPNSGKRKFIQGELKEGDLEKLIQEVSK
ncbi:MAG TPA: TlpA disulfide reductase family protein [Cyclobacteriaceae bacterium]|jgi:thiol-disulfide isomerase/thioredoxin|nr:TlpA disulfide reductase family protein [Cyclobacteriaceae bacterium]